MEDKILMTNGYTAERYDGTLTDNDFQKIIDAYENEPGYFSGILLDNYKSSDSIDLDGWKTTTVITLDELRNWSKSKAAFKNEKKKWLKNESFYDGSMTDIGCFMNKYMPEYEGKVYKYFNTMCNPKLIEKKTVVKFVKHGTSNNIYSVMTEPQLTVERIRFEVRLDKSVVEYYYIKDATLSVSEVASFL